MSSESSDGEVGLVESEADIDGGVDRDLAMAVVAAVALVLGVVLLVSELHRSPASADDVTGPLFFAVCVLGGWMLLSAVLLVSSAIAWWRARAGAEANLRESSGDADRAANGSWARNALASHGVRVVAIVMLLAVYANVLEPLGYVLATFLLMAVLPSLMGSRQVFRDVVVAVGLSFGLYLLFTQVIGIYLPPGVIPL